METNTLNWHTKRYVAHTFTYCTYCSLYMGCLGSKRP